MKKTLVAVATIVGIVCLIVAFMYWFTPASALPHFMPGYDPAMATPHVKHGIAAAVVGLALFAYAWFASAKKVS
jgi:hypothetical protein